MKNRFAIAKRACFGAMVCLFAAASAQADGKTNLITAREITTMAPCTVTFAKRMSEFSGAFTNSEGKAFVLGDIRGEQYVWHFVGALKEGQTYNFPDVFLNYQAASNYVTAGEIAAMPPCTATLASRNPCSSCFTTTDGKWFGIGDPGSGALISHFIWSVKNGETNKFPGAFLDFQAAPHYVTAREITEMGPRTGTFVHGWDGAGYFRAADGKGFFIGGRRSGEEGFLRTLEEDKSYKFPDAFLEYQKRNPTTKP